MLTVTYMALAGLGCAYLLLSLLLGHASDSSDGGGAHADGADTHGADAGGADGDAAGGHAAEGHAAHGAFAKAAAAARGLERAATRAAVSTGGRRAASFRFPLLSPLTLATLCATLGGLGLVARHGLGLGDGPSLLAAVPAALALTYVTTAVAWRLASSSRGTTILYEDDFAGAPGEVLAAIPEGGLGEVAAVVMGQRYAGPAREVSGRALPRGAQVVVLRRDGPTLVVGADREHGSFTRPRQRPSE